MHPTIVSPLDVEHANTRELFPVLRQHSNIDCDILDSTCMSVPRRLALDAPCRADDGSTRLALFADCTADPLTVLAEIQRLGNEYIPLIREARVWAVQTGHNGDASVMDLAVEYLMVKLLVPMAFLVSGRLHVQTLPKYAYSVKQTLKSAERLVRLFKQLAPNIDSSRLCISVIASWHGLKVCEILRNDTTGLFYGIATRAVATYSTAQILSALYRKCTYIKFLIRPLGAIILPAGQKTRFKSFCKILSLYRHRINLIHLTHVYAYKNTTTRVTAGSVSSCWDATELAGIDHVGLTKDHLSRLVQSFDYPVLNWQAPSLPRGVRDGDQSLLEREQARIDPLRDEEDYASWLPRHLASKDGSDAIDFQRALTCFCRAQNDLEEIITTVQDDNP
ncbi:hypothetical protein CDD81_8049 [Ophiocordyceps australis]|uniref:Transaldolase n=1 Tax=Ophiocordyceps australis TaxID=1399860 RepID=A0A2C5Y422_9HYPO|nr:hypothetical protein CDD81_8049 [Ophiocordyceps australis]